MSVRVQCGSMPPSSYLAHKKLPPHLLDAKGTCVLNTVVLRKPAVRRRWEKKYEATRPFSTGKKKKEGGPDTIFLSFRVLIPPKNEPGNFCGPNNEPGNFCGPNKMPTFLVKNNVPEWRSLAKFTNCPPNPPRCYSSVRRSSPHPLGSRYWPAVHLQTGFLIIEVPLLCHYHLS